MRSSPGRRPLVPVLARLAVAVLLTFAGAAQATTVARLTPSQVDALARRIVEGRVVASHVVQLEGTALHATEYEIAVDRVLKDDGSIAPQLAARNGILVIRQLGARLPGDTFTGIPGLPEYRIGARYRLALNGDSRRGLTSPVGFGQGVRILQDAPETTP